MEKYCMLSRCRWKSSISLTELSWNKCDSSFFLTECKLSLLCNKILAASKVISGTVSQQLRSNNKHNIDDYNEIIYTDKFQWFPNWLIHGWGSNWVKDWSEIEHVGFSNSPRNIGQTETVYLWVSFKFENQWLLNCSSTSRLPSKLTF